MNYSLNETFYVIDEELVYYPTNQSHDNQYWRTQHIKKYKKHINTEVDNVVRGHGLTPSFSDCELLLSFHFIFLVVPVLCCCGKVLLRNSKLYVHQ